jgi:hypothetical protein
MSFINSSPPVDLSDVFYASGLTFFFRSLFLPPPGIFEDA